MMDKLKGASGEEAAEAKALLDHLVETEKLELDGSAAALIEPIAKLLADVTPATMAELERLLLESDAVAEIYIDANELYELVYQGHHLGS